MILISARSARWLWSCAGSGQGGSPLRGCRSVSSALLLYNLEEHPVPDSGSGEDSAWFRS